MRHRAVRDGIAGLLLGLSGSCGLWPIAPAATDLTDMDRSQLPPCVDDDCNCEDFRDQPAAQQVLAALPHDPFVLDPDANGIACEALPATAAAIADASLPEESEEALLGGNPTNASRENLNNYLVVRSQYTLSYNSSRGTANWVSWQLGADWLGDSPRQDNFRSDQELPAGIYRVGPEDYDNTGYDRGHIVPSGDRTRTPDDNAATFLMTNVWPQAPEQNRGVWQELEAYGRDLVQSGDRTLWLMAGSYGDQARLAAGRVTVPTRLWKIVIILERGQMPDAIDANTAMIAVDMPNRDGIDDDWRTYQTTIDRIEVATGYDFLATVPADIQTVLEAQTLDLLDLAAMGMP